MFYVTRQMLATSGGLQKLPRASVKPTLVAGSRQTGNDEIGHLARTLNHMLDRIESSVNQLHTITDSLAHDLRSPLTAVRGKLETALATILWGITRNPLFQRSTNSTV